MNEETITTVVIMGAVCILFLALAWIMMQGKGSFLIAGYNTLPQKKKALFKEKELTAFIGKMMLVNSLIFFLIAINVVFAYTPGYLILIGLFIVSIVYTIIIGNSSRFKKMQKKK